MKISPLALLQWSPILLASMLLVVRPAIAQEVSGSIGGLVRDATGQPVAGAEVAATHLDTGVVRRALTSAGGLYTFTALPVGTHDVVVSLPGFKTVTRRGIDLHLSDRLRVDVTLEVGDITEEVSVEAKASLVETQTSDQSGLISGDQVRDLQLNGRSFMTLLELLPGVSSDLPDRTDPNTNPNVSINGARSTASNFNIDGGNNADVVVGSSSLNTFTSIDTIEEVKVITSNFSAEYGKGGFSQINVVTKAGGRKFKGSAYEFFRHDALDSRDFLSDQVLPLRYNNFGFTVGGPVLLPGGYNRDRSKTFFFYAQDFNYVTARGESVNTTVPTAAERAGDFRGLGPGADGTFGTTDDPVIDPLTGRGFEGGVIPADRLNPDALRLLSLYPLPNFSGLGTLNYTSAEASRQRFRQELIRVDHHFSTAWKGFVRYAQDHAHIDNPYGGSGLRSVTTRFPGLGNTRADRPGKNLVMNLTGILSPTLLNELSVTWANRVFTMNPTSDRADRTALGLGLQEIFPENEGNVIPTITLGSGLATIVAPRFSHKVLHNVEVSDKVTKLVGRHNVKVGGLYSFGTNREHPFSPNVNGNYTFTTAGSRNPVANLLLGLPSTYTEVERLVVSHSRFSMFEAFVQDDFRVSDRLTVNAGLRYSAFFNPHDADDVLTNFLPSEFDPAQAPRIDPVSGRPVPGTGDPLNGIVLAGIDSPYGRRVTENNTSLLAPRIGFAWDPFGGQKTAVRAAFGVYHTRPLIGTFIENSFGNPPFSRTVTIQSPSLVSPAGGREAPANAPNLTALGTPLEAPRMHQWSVGVQQEFFGDTLVNVAYVGSRGKDLLRPVPINDPRAGAAAAGGVHMNAVRPFPGYGSIISRQSTGSSKYDALQMSLNRRVSKGLSLGAAYTLSRSRDDASSDRARGDIPPNAYDLSAEWAPSDFDRTHVFAGNYIWRVPIHAAGGWRAAVLNGWELSGITRISSGKPLDVTISSDVAGIGGVQNQRPNVTGDTVGPQTPEQWFNTAAFTRPANGTFGNLGRNALRGPGLHRWDMAVYKTFALRGKSRLQLRVEAFNVFNQRSYTEIGTALTTTSAGVDPAVGNFGVATSAGDPRVLQLALKATF